MNVQNKLFTLLSEHGIDALHALGCMPKEVTLTVSPIGCLVMLLPQEVLEAGEILPIVYEPEMLFPKDAYAINTFRECMGGCRKEIDSGVGFFVQRVYAEETREQVRELCEERWNPLAPLWEIHTEGLPFDTNPPLKEGFVLFCEDCFEHITDIADEYAVTTRTDINGRAPFTVFMHVALEKQYDDIGALLETYGTWWQDEAMFKKFGRGMVEATSSTQHMLRSMIRTSLTVSKKTNEQERALRYLRQIVTDTLMRQRKDQEIFVVRKFREDLVDNRKCLVQYVKLNMPDGSVQWVMNTTPDGDVLMNLEESGWPYNRSTWFHI